MMEKSINIQVIDHDGLGDAASTPEMKEWNKVNGYEDTVYSLELID